MKHQVWWALKRTVVLNQNQVNKAWNTIMVKLNSH